ncbi:PAS domain S-box protein [bacterium]|nr:PAS domain S-box protein [bacterium]
MQRDLEKHLKRIAELEADNYRLNTSLDGYLRKQKELWSSVETFYKMMTESSITSTILVDEDENLIFFNPAFSRLVGYSERELSSMNLKQLTSEKEFHKFEKLTCERKKGFRSRYETIFITKEKKKKNILVEASPIIDPDGKFIGTTSSLVDISKQKLNEKRLKESERKMTLLFDHAPVGYCLLDMEGIVRHINSAFEKYTGLSSDEVLEKEFVDLPIFFPKDIAAIRAISGKICKSESVTGKELTIKCSNCDRKDVEVNCYPIILEGEKMILYALWDITERKIIEEGKEKAFNDLEKIVHERTFEITRINNKLESEISKKETARKNLSESYEKLQRILEETVNALTAAVEKRDPYTSGHQQTVSEIAYLIAKEMNFSPDDIEGMRIAGLLHDIGKITVPAEILSKPSKLTQMEFNIIKMHSSEGYDILKGIEFPWPIAKMVLQHHERIDGSGYPNGLSGLDILIEAQIIAASDIIEAISSHRPYRPSLGIDFAIEELFREPEKYNPEILEAVKTLYDQGKLQALFK